MTPTPYTRFLGIEISSDGKRPVLTLPSSTDHAGRPGYMHGGAIAGLVESAAWAVVRDAIADDTRTLKPLSISMEFLRGGRMETSFASGRVLRLGRRLAQVEAWAWQAEEAEPILVATVKFLISSPRHPREETPE